MNTKRLSKDNLRNRLNVWWSHPTFCVKLSNKLIELAHLNSTPQPFHHTLIVPEIMNRVECCSEDLTAFVEMMEISSTVVLTGIAIAGLINRPFIGSIRRIP